MRLFAAALAGLAGWAGALCAGTAGADDRLTLLLPLDCRPETECVVVKYVDRKPGPEMRDYACGDLHGGENDYPATSIAVRDLTTMRQGVDVLAAAAGVTLRIRDGMDDNGVFDDARKKELSPTGCGNAVVLDHGGGWTTAYCHLRQGSVKVKPGDVVTAGRPIAQVGLSGLSELPHLHFQVRRRNAVVDPFAPDMTADACAVAAPLWNEKALKTLTPYRPVIIRLSGFSQTAPTDRREMRTGGPPKPLSACAPKLSFWTEVFGLRTGDAVSLRVVAPDGATVAKSVTTINRNTAQAAPTLEARRAAAVWPAGTYLGMIEIRRGTQIFRQETPWPVAPPADGRC